MIYITFHTKQNYFLFYDNKIYHLLNLENNNIETIKSSGYFKYKLKKKISKFNSSSFSMPRSITSDKTRKGEASCNPTETTNRISLIRLHGVTPPNPERGGRGEVRHIRNRIAHKCSPIGRLAYGSALKLPYARSLKRVACSSRILFHRHAHSYKFESAISSRGLRLSFFRSLLCLFFLTFHSKLSRL